ncbi:MAG: glutathione peroxidase [Lachnospiraceae bacterium]|nr:glutathione peroxidase [Lachnospiraceae bacterium]
MSTLYDFTVKDQEGKDVSLKDYEGKVVLVINSATECGFTPHYQWLQEIYQDLHEKGLEILDFPCNQFANQTPGDDAEIHQFCTGRFGVTFPQFSKVDVNGENAIPLWQWLTTETTFQGFHGAAKLLLTPVVKKMDPNYKNNGKIKWNFTKFLIGKNGEIVQRFEPTADAKEVRAGIEALL